MNLGQAMEALAAKADPKVKKLSIRNGATEEQFGVKLGEIRALAKSIKSNHPLALELWASGCLDAQLLACLILKPDQLSVEELEKMASETTSVQLADWLISYVVKERKDKEALRVKWMASTQPIEARAGWSLTASRAAKSPEGLDLDGLLDRIESEMAGADPLVQWTMNSCLAEIGINDPSRRARALEIGERLGIYRDYPTPKGCTSPFAPLWIGEMVKRQTV